LTNKKEKFIAELVKEHKPIKVLAPPYLRALLMASLSLGGLFLIMWLRGPLREDLFSHLAETPRFLVELLAGLGLYYGLLFLSLKNSIPGEDVRSKEKKLITLTAVGLVLSLILFFFEDHSAHGDMRYHCNVEVMLYSVLLIPLYALALKKAAPRLSTTRLYLFGLSAGLAPAILMQVFCTYSASHSVFAHYLPALIGALLTPALVKLFRLKITS
jgi:hypothetical protein